MAILNAFLEFVFIFLTISLVLSLLGWYWLALKYKYKGDFKGTSIGIISAEINSVVSYRSCIVLKVNSEGFYLKPLLLFRCFHEPLFIPWDEIKKIQDRRFLFVRYKKLFIGDSLLSIKISESNFLKMEDVLNKKL